MFLLEVYKILPCDLLDTSFPGYCSLSWISSDELDQSLSKFNQNFTKQNSKMQNWYFQFFLNTGKCYRNALSFVIKLAVCTIQDYEIIKREELNWLTFIFHIKFDIYIWYVRGKIIQFIRSQTPFWRKMKCSFYFLIFWHIEEFLWYKRVTFKDNRGTMERCWLILQDLILSLCLYRSISISCLSGPNSVSSSSSSSSSSVWGSLYLLQPHSHSDSTILPP